MAKSKVARKKLINVSRPRAKLTDHDVELIRRLAEEGLSYTQIAEKFEIARRAARRR